MKNSKKAHNREKILEDHFSEGLDGPKMFDDIKKSQINTIAKVHKVRLNAKVDPRIDRVMKKKNELLELAKRGNERPHKLSSNGVALNNYTSGASNAFDEAFTNEIKGIAPKTITEKEGFMSKNQKKQANRNAASKTPEQEKTKPVPTSKTKVNQVIKIIKQDKVVKIVDLVRWFNEGVIVPYARNRSAGGDLKKIVDLKRCMEMANRFNPEGLGLITLGMRGDELTITDGHHRLYMLSQLEKSGLLNQYKNVTCHASISEEGKFIENYVILNDQKAQPLGSKLSNPDLPFGGYLKSIIKETKLPENKFFIPNVSDALLGYNSAKKAGQPMSLSYLYSARKLTSQLANSLDSIGSVVPISTKLEFNQALNFYVDFLKETQEHGVISRTIEKRIKASPGLLMVIMVDALSNKKLMSRGSEALAVAALHGGIDLIDAASTVSRRDLSKVDWNACEKILLGGSAKGKFEIVLRNARKDKKERAKSKK